MTGTHSAAPTYIEALVNVALINPESVTKGFPHEEIEYIDISSVGSGTLEGAVHYRLVDAPSRAKRLVSHGDTIVSTVRPNRRSFLFVKHPLPNLVVSTGFAVLRPTTKIAPRFLYYTVSNQAFTDYLTANAKGAAYPAVDTETFERAEINVPPVDVQRKVAAILSAYDDLIENNIRRIRTHEEMAQMIYREWFVKFRFPGHENVKMVDSELGLIPEGWEAKKLGEVIELAYGKSLTADKRRGGQIPVYGSAGTVGYHDSALAKGPGIIVGRKGNVGSIHWSEDDFFAIDTVFFVQTSLSLYYCCFNLRDQNFLNTDAAVPGLNRNQAYRNLFLVPGREVLNSFDRTVAHLFGQIKTLGRKNANLRQTRDLLLPKLISGEADVEDLDIDIGEAPA